MHTQSLPRIGAGLFALAALALPALASAAQVNVVMADNAYAPQTITVTQGDTVVWTNSGGTQHTVTADFNAFSSGSLAPGQSFSYQFNNVGTYAYHCIFHTGMVGTVIVRPSSSGSTGTSVPPNIAQLQGQVIALLAQVETLQRQLGRGSAGAPGASQGVPGLAQQAGVKVVDSSSCPKIGRSLKRGMSGDDIARLQQFLARDPSIYPEGTVSGFYGALTEAAVRRWQVKFNIVSTGSPESTGFGVVGPRTAAAISLQCSLYAGSGGVKNAVGGYVQVSPIAGNAPLTVNVQATVNTTNSCAAAVYELAWGDGTPGVQIPAGGGNCTQLSQTYSHVYQNPGTYVITLSALGHVTSATVTVYGTAPQPQPQPQPQPVAYGPLHVTPNASNPLAVTASFDIPTQCTGYVLTWGDGTNDAVQQDGGSGCAAGVTPVSIVHQYAVAGTYSIVLRRGPTLSQSDTATITITY